MTRQERIREVLDNYGTRDLVSIVSYINSWDGSFEGEDWREMDLYEIWESISDSSDFESAMRAASNGDFDPRDDYYRWSYYSGLESSDDPDFDLNEIADWINENFHRVDDVLSSYYASDFEDCDVEEPDDDPLDPTDWPDDPTDYDGEDEDEPAEAADPAPAEGIRVTTYGEPLNPEEARRAMQRLFPTLMGMFDSTPENSDLWQSQVVNTIAQNCLANSGRYPISDADLIVSTYRVFPGAAAVDDQPA